MNSLGSEAAAKKHFAFGENWSKFVELVDEAKIDLATKAFERLLGDVVAGASVIDIGSGSGLHALAALRLKASHVLAVDIDARSVETTRRLLEARAPGLDWDCCVGDILNLDPAIDGRFDIVYSWGVLHHTGAMFEAIKRAAAMVRPGGYFCIAIYAKTPLCWFWKIEKRLYSSSSASVQKIFRAAYSGLFLLVATLGALKHRRGKFRLSEHRKNYHSIRGMDHDTDVHDWLGGYPYESAKPDQIEKFVVQLGFEPIRHFIHGKPTGILGSGCNEFVFRSTAPAR